MKSSIFVEEWRDIPGYEGLYQISNLGRVRSLDRIVSATNGKTFHYKSKIKKQTKDSKKYFQVSLNKNNKDINFSVHRLVAQAFLPNPDNLPEVNHINECRWDNAVWNLEWCTHIYNCNYGSRTIRSAKSHINHPKRSKPVLQYTLDGQFVAEYPSISEVKRQTGINDAHIPACCKGKRNCCGGYRWRYKN